MRRNEAFIGVRNIYFSGFTFDDYKAKVDGIPRYDGAKAVLTDFSDIK